MIATPLTVGYFGGKDGLDKQLNILKVVAYLDVGDGNYWAHPIENLVAVVDLDKEKLLRLKKARSFLYQWQIDLICRISQ